MLIRYPASMKPTGTPSAEGKGSGRFRIGFGADATGGDLEVDLRCYADRPNEATVEWQVDDDRMPAEGRRETIEYLEWYLRDYLQLHPVGALHVAVVGAGWWSDRRNEPKRAAFIAVHQAMTNAGLPPRPLFAPPEDAG